jgi:hypothetical protein
MSMAKPAAQPPELKRRVVTQIAQEFERQLERRYVLPPCKKKPADELPIGTKLALWRTACELLVRNGVLASEVDSPNGRVLLSRPGRMGRGVAVRHAARKSSPLQKLTHGLTGYRQTSERS